LLLVPVIYATFVLDLKLVRWDAREQTAIEAPVDAAVSMARGRECASDAALGFVPRRLRSGTCLFNPVQGVTDVTPQGGRKAREEHQ
jgi:hypothetical protein